MISHDTKWYPTTSTTTSPSTNTSTSITTAAAATTSTTRTEFATAAAIETNVKVVGGDLGKGVVFLSDNQIADLLERMDIDAFDHYVDKLSSFIIKNNAHVKNHYETILRWWEEDSTLRGQ